MIALWGANGFIGRHVSLKIINSDQPSLYISRDFRDFPFDSIDHQQMLVADFQYPNSYIDKLSNIDTFILLVTGSLARTFSNIEDEVEQNLRPYQRFFEALSKHTQKKPHLIYISSGGAIYGHTSHDPITENHKKNPLSPYGKGKELIEQAVIRTACNNNWPYTIVRPSNPVGKWGKSVIFHALNAAKTNTEFSIYGDGQTTRDYFCVTELADAIYNISQDTISHNKTYNIGSGIGHNINEIIQIIERISGVKMNIKNIDEVQTDVPYNVLDCTKIKNDLGWTAQKPLQQIIKNMWENS